MSTRNTVAVRQGQTSVLPPDQLLRDLDERRDHHAALRDAAIKTDDFSVAGEQEPLVQIYHDAGKHLRALMAQNEAMRRVLVSRVLVELEVAEKPPWKATHRHYKGTLYRATGERMNADHEELEPMVEYDDADGRRFVISKRRWESHLESGRPRYEYVYEGGRT